MNELPVLMGERFEVLVDISDGKSFDLVTLPVSQDGDGCCAIRISHTRFYVFSRCRSPPPVRCADTLTTLPGASIAGWLAQRKLQLSMDPMLDMMGMQALMKSTAIRRWRGCTTGR